MKLKWPDSAKVDAAHPHGETLALVRWYWHLPEPTTDEERYVVERVREKLAEVTPDHLGVICAATGYEIPSAA